MGNIPVFIASASAVVGSVIALLGLYRRALKEEREKGRQDEEFKNMKKSLDSAHQKIRDMEMEHSRTDDEVIKIGERLNGIEEAQRETNKRLGQLIQLHLQEAKK